MKKLFDSNIFYFILGAIIFGGIGSVLAYTIVSSDVEYTSDDLSWKNSDGTAIENTKHAIDNLYTKINNMQFTELYTYSPGSPANYSYTFPDNTKNILIFIATIRDENASESDWTISLPVEATELYDLYYGEMINGRRGYNHTRAYFIENATGTVSGRISYRGSIKIIQINK